MEGIDAQAIAEEDLSGNGGISLLVADDSQIYNDSIYHKYSRYSRYRDYYNYSNYSNTTSITTNPTNQSVELGNTVIFSIVASNASIVTAYQ